MRYSLADEKTLKELKNYFNQRDDVAMAFLFGSRAEGRAKPTSDWDIGIYFNPRGIMELETKKEYAGETEIRKEISNIIKSETDVVILNRAQQALVFDVLNSGAELVNKDQGLYLELLSKTHYEAIDYWNFVKEFWQIREQAKSLTAKAKALIIEHLTFLENELSDAGKFQKMAWQEYREDRDKRRNIERWVENVVMSLLDIAKITLASEKRDVPQTYREALKEFSAVVVYPNADELAEFSELRNIIAHESLDMRWDRIKRFTEKAHQLMPGVLEKIKSYLNR